MILVRPEWLIWNSWIRISVDCYMSTNCLSTEASWMNMEASIKKTLKSQKVVTCQ